ncbi:hypothetical protein F2P56_036273 [Juglans regia]|uniref:GDSL esterase/lipase At5g55050-like n=2 Tax=Juglans regia TaxID=51240 RepID=A0A2I4GBP3_JUGRE|nr:GDSL esterase/lipase At5g55050-like [Juglans regia]KAF5443738.1 hypothetical protein F2P56_036273 [Juglans regia]
MAEISFAILLLSLATIILNVNADAGRPAVFILGDSTADVGTNNFLPGSQARADFPFNGVDFAFSIPTGRFSNGLNSADFLAKLLGYEKSPPPYLSTVNYSRYSLTRQALKGINFASGGSGIFRLTGQLPSDSPNGGKQNVIPMAGQIAQFEIVRSSLVAAMGPLPTLRFLSKSLFFISIGSNDIFEYYRSNNNLSKERFFANLGFAYENQLKALLELGARKFGIISVPSIGCCPSQRLNSPNGGCLEELNDHARAFHTKIKSILCRLNEEYQGMKYSLGNAYEMTINVIDNPLPYNFTNVKIACCGVGRLNAESNCNPNANLCPSRNNYLFWDLFHPTESAAQLAAVTLFSGPTRFVAPINFSQLAQA